MRIEDLIQNLETHWDSDCFLDAVRRGNFLPSDAEAFLGVVRAITISDDACVPKRLISFLWYLLPLLEWQKESVVRVSPAQASAYERFDTEVHNALEVVFGIP